MNIPLRHHTKTNKKQTKENNKTYTVTNKKMLQFIVLSIAHKNVHTQGEASLI